MKRREIVAIFGASVFVWSRATRAQQSSIPVIGFLNSASPGPWAHLTVARLHALPCVANVAEWIDRLTVPGARVDEVIR